MRPSSDWGPPCGAKANPQRQHLACGWNAELSASTKSMPTRPTNPWPDTAIGVSVENGVEGLLAYTSPQPVSVKRLNPGA
jgi:hypothetical protein